MIVVLNFEFNLNFKYWTGSTADDMQGLPIEGEGGWGGPLTMSFTTS